MLEATPDGADSSTYQVTSDGNAVATLEFRGRVGESGAIAGGHGYLTIRRENTASGAWLLEQQDDGAGPQVVATAEKPSAMRSNFVLRTPGRPEMQLKRPSAWKPVFNVTEADRKVGTIRRARGFRLRVQADIHDHVPATLQLFALWTAVLIERRTRNQRTAARAAR
jgi:hypothetical protein